MIKDKKEMSKNIEIDLNGPQGNAFALMGYARGYAKQLGLDGDKIIEDMMSGDYDHLIDIFDENFGEFITLYR